MTSNQLQFAYNQELERHNRQQEELTKEQQRIDEEANKQVKRYQTAQVLLGVSNELNKAGGIANQAAANMTQQVKVYTEAQNMYAQRKLAEKQQALNVDMSTENIRHMREQDKIALREMSNKERLTELQAKMNEMTISNMLFEQNKAVTEGWYKQAQLVLAERAQTNAEFQSSIQAAQTLFNGQRLLMDQKTQKYKIPTDVVNAQANAIKALSSIILGGL